jgi:hypothetical protein
MLEEWPGEIKMTLEGILNPMLNGSSKFDWKKHAETNRTSIDEIFGWGSENIPPSTPERLRNHLLHSDQLILHNIPKVPSISQCPQEF